MKEDPNKNYKHRSDKDYADCHNQFIRAYDLAALGDIVHPTLIKRHLKGIAFMKLVYNMKAKSKNFINANWKAVNAKNEYEYDEIAPDNLD